jgi:mannosyltransferase OCH1-like enzyme
MAHIWIGPLEPPIDWMRSWPAQNPDWDYRLYDNAFCQSRRFRNQTLIDEYMRRAEYAGAADLIRYELLLDHGGFIPEADSVCLRPVAPLFRSGNLFTVYENEFVRGRLVSPILAAAPEHPFLQALVDRLASLPPDRLGTPWHTTGNLFVARMIEELEPAITIFPSHYFIPEHYTGVRYEGDGPIYAEQRFGTTRRAYRALGLWTRFLESRKRRYRRRSRAK